MSSLWQFTCHFPNCGKIFKTRQQKYYHSQANLPKPICGGSNSVFSRSDNLSTHQKTCKEFILKSKVDKMDPCSVVLLRLPLLGMTKEVQQQLIGNNFFFKKNDRFLQAANACRLWPIGRGIYHNDKKNFLVWVNEEDHIRIICTEQEGDFATTYKRMVAGVTEIEKRLPFSHSDRFGFLTVCPTNLGTTITVCVQIKLPKLALKKAKLYITSAIYNLEVRECGWGQDGCLLI